MKKTMIFFAAMLAAGLAALADSPFDAWHVGGDWYTAENARLDSMNEKRLIGDRGEGVLINGRIGKTKSLITKRRDYRDVELHVEFMVAKGSNSGIIFHGNYEIQIMDSAHVKEPTGGHCGGIYPRAEEKPTYRHIDKGSPPRVNAAKKPGEWQTMDILFQSPRFDKNGKKTANARFVRVVHNDQVIQENVEVPYASGPNWNRRQHPQGPIIIQGDYGPIALRNVRVRDWQGAGASVAKELNVPPPGFTALFNGKDFTGFNVNPKVEKMWSIEDGVLKAPHLLEQWGADLQTKKEYKDFVLLADFRMPAESDSGIHFRKLITDMGTFGQAEQINLGTGLRMGQLESLGYMRGSKMEAAKRLNPGDLPKINPVDPKIGQWHTIKITMVGRTLMTELDGEVMVDRYEYPEWHLGTGAAPIRFQKHRFLEDEATGRKNPCPIEYRNLFIKEITDAPPVQQAKLNVPPEGFAALFNGKNFAGWHTPPLVREYWKIEDGILKSPGLIEGWGASLSTEKLYRDFILMFDFRMPTLSDSGINFRRLIPEIPGFGDMEQFNLRSKGGMGHLESYYFLPKETAKKMKLKEEEKPHCRHIDPEVGVWHTVKLTMQGRTFSAEYDGELIHDNFKYHDWMIDMEPAPIRLQKHIVVYGENLGATNACPIEYRNIFIKEIKPAPRRPALKSVAGGGKRFWTSSDGSRTVEAEFIEDQGDTIILKRSNGKRVAIPLDQLSRKDNEWVIDWREEAVLAKAAKPSVSPKPGARFEDVSSVPSTPLPDGASPRPNVIILLADDLGYRDIGCYDGPVKTPVLDELAANGVRFTDFHSGCPVCSPSRAVALTGRHHIRTGVYSVIQDSVHNMHLLEREVTLAEVLRDNGYATAHFGKWHLGMPVGKRDKPTPTEHGFDYWFGLVNGANPSHKDPVNFLRNGKPVGPMKGYSCGIVVDEAISWLQETGAPDAPFFLNIWFNEPHAPIAAPDEIVSHYGKLSDPAAIYSGTIENTDHAIAKLLKHLKDIGELDNTIVVYSSDNGSYRSDRVGKLRGKKGSNFEGGHRVPGIFYWKKGIPGGRVEDEPAGMVDWLPTICGLVGIEKPKGVYLDGSDLAPLLTRNGTFERHQPLFWLRPEGGEAMMLREGDFAAAGYCDFELPSNWQEINGLITQIGEVLGQDARADDGSGGIRSAVFSDTFKNKEAARLQQQVKQLNMFQESSIPAMKAGSIGRVELYDLSKDISQKTNVADQHPEVVARMKERMNAIYASVMADAPEWVSIEDAPARPVAEAAGSEMEKLLVRIDATELPKGYSGSIHQKYVDERMKKMTSGQRARVGRLWKEKRRLDPDMPNRGAAFVKILEHVASEEKAERGSD